MKLNKGFTLVEIMTAIAVIGILFTVAFPAYQNYLAKADVDSCLKYITPARMTADNLILSAGGSADNTVIADAAALGLADLTDCNVTIQNQTNTGNIDIVGVSRGNTMRLSRNGVDGTWGCTSSDTNLGNISCP